MGQEEVLNALMQEKRLTVKQLAEKIKVGHSSINTTIRKLLHQKLIHVHGTVECNKKGSFVPIYELTPLYYKI